MNAYDKQQPDTIRSLFNSIARNYDKTNALLSCSLNKRWNRALIRAVLQSAKPLKFLDLCCGTGAIAFDYLKTVQTPVQAYLLDFSEEMLQCAKSAAETLKLERHQIQYLQADAQKIPLKNSEVGCVTIAYGIRNILQPQACIQEVYRVLEPGGCFGILELTRPSHPLMRLGHSLYLKIAVPCIGKLCTSNAAAYRYLKNSIRQFASPAELEEMLRQAGFSNLRCTPLFGGTATLLTAVKPL
jgi:demethylmenaquinone methyltransferase / 2-methoxy-6-polyprenyl-1,4-benzoquinol methylase